MKKSIIGSEYEFSLRTLLLLNKLSKYDLNERQIALIDFIAVYAHDFDLAESNLHAEGTFRFSEFSVRYELAKKSVHYLAIKGLIDINSNTKGLNFSINEFGKSICKDISTEYSDNYIEYLGFVETVYSPFEYATLSGLINEKAIKSIQEV